MLNDEIKIILGVLLFDFRQQSMLIKAVMEITPLRIGQEQL